jgi:hypothetical protein
LKSFTRVREKRGIKLPEDKNPSAGGPRRKIFRHTKPIFVTLKEGESIAGVFLGIVGTQYGTCYKIKTAEGIRLLAGNRFQLDQIIDEMRFDSEEFPSGGLEGHCLEVKRLSESVGLEKGRTVAQYEVSHLIDGCPFGCGAATSKKGEREIT